jgi:hypothetical protein
MNQELPASESPRTDLARALGFPNYPNDAAAEPYLNHITNRCIRGDTMEEYIKLLVAVVRHFDVAPTAVPAKKSIQELLDVVSSSSAYAHRNREDVEDTVLYVIGTWTLLLSSFIHLPMAGGLRKVVAAYTLRTHCSPSRCQPYGEDLIRLVAGSGLLPAHTVFTSRTHTLWKLFAAYRYAPFAFPQAHSGIALDTSGRFRSMHLYLLRKLQTNKSILRLSTRPGLSGVAHNQCHAA